MLHGGGSHTTNSLNGASLESEGGTEHYIRLRKDSGVADTFPLPNLTLSACPQTFVVGWICPAVYPMFKSCDVCTIRQATTSPWYKEVPTENARISEFPGGPVNVGPTLS